MTERECIGLQLEGRMAEGEKCSVFGVSCKDMTREELLGAIGIVSVNMRSIQEQHTHQLDFLDQALRR